MGVTIAREKPRSILLSILYRLKKLPVSDKHKFRLFLNLEWIFDQLCHEMSFRCYQDLEHPARIFSTKFILDFIDTKHAVLDLGCSEGILSAVIAAKAKTVVGVDHNKAAIETAKKIHNSSNLTFSHCGAFEYLQSNPQKFDVLILSHILEHLDDPKHFLLKFRNYFTYIYIEVPDFNRSYLNQYRKDMNMPFIFMDSDHISEFDRDDLKSLLDDSGLEILQSEYRFGVQKYWLEAQQNKCAE